jgi:hypothetical protein
MGGQTGFAWFGQGLVSLGPHSAWAASFFFRSGSFSYAGVGASRIGLVRPVSLGVGDVPGGSKMVTSLLHFTFVHYPANTFSGQTTEWKDDAHFNAYGAYELARCIVQNIRDQHLPLAPYLRKGVAAFSPAHPDALAEWHLPASPAITVETPYGR